MTTTDETVTKPESQLETSVSAPVPVLLLAYCPSDNEHTVDRWQLKGELTFGRKRPATVIIDDKYLSRPHFRISSDEEAVYLDDLNSTNGTFINGIPHIGRKKLEDADIIRAGRSIFVFHEDDEFLLDPCPPDIYGIGGRFHVAPLLKEIQRFSSPRTHVLISGPTGTGKELAAHALARMGRIELVEQNAARLTSEGEAEVSLFGVGSKVFTDVAARVGLIELADGKALFLDEAHTLPQRVQRTLLRVVEDWQVSRVGETESKRVNVKFIMASNDLSPDYGIEPDLLARMRVLRISSLKERVADIPSLFRYLLKSRVNDAGLDPEPVLECIVADYQESLCLDGFEKNNTRGLITIVDDIVTDLTNGVSAEKAVKSTFERRYKKNLVLSRHSKSSRKKQGKDRQATENGERNSNVDMAELTTKFNLDAETVGLIKDTYYSQKGVVKDMVAHLKTEYGIRTSHRRIKNIVDALRLPRLKRQR